MELGRAREREPGGLVSFDWYRTLSANGKRGFWASAAGWALDAFDIQVLTFGLVAIAAAFHPTWPPSGTCLCSAPASRSFPLSSAPTSAT
jgi:hypothetical protein